MRRNQGFSLMEVLIGMMIFTIGLLLIYVIPSSIVRESKEISSKMSLYQVAINEAEHLISLPKDSDKLNSGTHETSISFNGASYTKIYEIDTVDVQIDKHLIIDNIPDDTPEATTMVIKYASITFLDESGDYAVS